MHHYLAGWKKYAQFSGRSQRAEYWSFMLINFGIIMVLAGISDQVNKAFDALIGLFGLALLIPAIAVSVRRLHDIGKSGWWLFLKLIPIIGDIILFVFMLFDSKPGDNKYGPNPKGISSPTPSQPTPAA